MPKEARGWLIFTVLLAVPMSFLLTASLLGRSLRALADATGGLIPPFLVFHLVSLVLIVGLLILGLGRLRPRDIGLVSSNLGVGLTVMAIAWTLTQFALAIIALVTTGGLALNDDWSERGVVAMAGLLVGNLLGTALVEETVFRGFFLPQLFVKLRRIMSGRRVALATALVLSAIFFSLVHVPPLLFHDSTLGRIGAAVLVTIAGGLYGGLLYIRTQNLFLVMGLHALHNAPTAIFQSAPATPMLVTGAIGLILIWLWPHLARRFPILRSRHRWLGR